MWSSLIGCSQFCVCVCVCVRVRVRERESNVILTHLVWQHSYCSPAILGSDCC